MTYPNLRASVRATALYFDAILLPTTPQTVFVPGTRAPPNQACFTALTNIVRAPSITLPAGFDTAGLPIGTQLTGAPGSDDHLLGLAAALDRALGHFRPTQE